MCHYIIKHQASTLPNIHAPHRTNTPSIPFSHLHLHLASPTFHNSTRKPSSLHPQSFISPIPLPKPLPPSLHIPLQALIHLPLIHHALTIPICPVLAFLTNLKCAPCGASSANRDEFSTPRTSFDVICRDVQFMTREMRWWWAWSSKGRGRLVGWWRSWGIGWRGGERGWEEWVGRVGRKGAEGKGREL